MGTPARSFQAATTKGKALVKNGYLLLIVRTDKEQDAPRRKTSEQFAKCWLGKATSLDENAHFPFIPPTLHTVPWHLYCLHCLKTGPGLRFKNSGKMPSSQLHHN